MQLKSYIARVTRNGATRDKYGWKLFNYAWTAATPGEHTLVSRAIDMTGRIQPTAQELGRS